MANPGYLAPPSSVTPPGRQQCRDRRPPSETIEPVGGQALLRLDPRVVERRQAAIPRQERRVRLVVALHFLSA